MPKPTPLLHRDDPDREPLTGNIKVTREDWLNVALDVLISDGVEMVKVLPLGERPGVSRSSFYWYFKSRQDLLDALLEHWRETNAAALVTQSRQQAETITGAVLNVFRCVVNPALFDTTLDFAVREWARRSGRVRKVLDQSNQRSLDALQAMFERFDYDPAEARIRARVLFYMQLGYNDAELNETLEERIEQVAMYLYVFTGKRPQDAELADFARYARGVEAQG